MAVIVADHLALLQAEAYKASKTSPISVSGGIGHAVWFSAAAPAFSSHWPLTPIAVLSRRTA